jgi:hypothetical protein
MHATLFLFSLSPKAQFSLSKCILECFLLLCVRYGHCTMTICETSKLSDMEFRCRGGGWGSTPTWHAGEALKRASRCNKGRRHDIAYIDKEKACRTEL